MKHGPRNESITTATRARDAASGLGPCHILYVDDDASYAYLLKVSLGRLGHKVTTFSNPRAALAALASPDAEYDAFVTDFNLPVTSGVELALEARRRRPGLPCAVVSTQIEDTMPLASEVKVLALPKAYLPHEFNELLARVLAQV